MNTKKILIELKDFIDKLIDKIDESETSKKHSLDIEPPYHSRNIRITSHEGYCGGGGCGGSHSNNNNGYCGIRGKC